MDSKEPQQYATPAQTQLISSHEKVLGWILAIIIVGAASFWLGGQFNFFKTSPEIQEERLPVSQMENKYTNTYFGFEFGYPTSSNVKENLQVAFDLAPEDPNNATFDWLSLQVDGTFNLEVNQPGTGYGGYQIVDETFLTIGGAQAKKTTMEEVEVPNPLRIYLYEFNKNGNGYLISAQNELLAEQILGTFRFTN
jgi:hypothetical protein